jgi:hypothetical protein
MRANNSGAELATPVTALPPMLRPTRTTGPWSATRRTGPARVGDIVIQGELGHGRRRGREHFTVLWALVAGAKYDVDSMAGQFDRQGAVPSQGKLADQQEST